MPDFAFQTVREIKQPFESQETIIMPRKPTNGATQNGKAKPTMFVLKTELRGTTVPTTASPDTTRFDYRPGL